MPRITKATLEAENAQLRKEVTDLSARLKEAREGPRARSRSPRRDDERTRMALRVVANCERDQVVHEQCETIARQQQVIQDLREGKGPIGEVLLATRRRKYPTLVDDFTIRHLGGAKMPVCDFIEKVKNLTSDATDTLSWGRSMQERWS